MRRSCPFALLVVAALALAGCGDHRPDAVPLPISPPTSVPPGCADAGGGVPPGVDNPCGEPYTDVLGVPRGPVVIVGATPGGTITVLGGRGLRSADPTQSQDPLSRSILGGLTTRALTQYGYDAATHRRVLVPDLATDTGTHDDDFGRWSFTLRDGVRYEDGTTVTVDDVVRGLLDAFRHDDPPVGLLHGARSVKVRGNTVTITLRAPFADLPYWVAEPATGPQRADGAVKATGPYRVLSFVPERSLRLARNPEWDPATDPGRTQYPDGYHFRLDATDAEVQDVLDGDQPTSLTVDDVTVTSAAYDPRLVTGRELCASYWAPDQRRVTDLRVRQALGDAYPYDIDVFLDGENLIPPGVPGRTRYPRDRDQPRTDALLARRILRRAGASGFTLRWFYARDDPAAVARERREVSVLRQSGFDPEPVATTSARLAAVQSAPDAPVNVRVGEHCPRWATGAQALLPLIAPDNPAYFRGSRVRRQVARIAVESVAEQPASWNRLDRAVMNRYRPYVVTGYGTAWLAHGDRVMGMGVDPLGGMPTWKHLWVTGNGGS